MTDTIIVPKWLYERLVAREGREAADRTMARYGAVAVASWQEAVDLESVKKKVNRG